MAKNYVKNNCVEQFRFNDVHFIVSYATVDNKSINNMYQILFV